VNIGSDGAITALPGDFREDFLAKSAQMASKFEDEGITVQRSTYLEMSSVWYSTLRERRVEPSMCRRLKRMGARLTESTTDPDNGSAPIMYPS
jgi:hypothetical protein